MSDLIENIINRNFENAKVAFFEGKVKSMHEMIIEAAYTTDDKIYSEFYEYLLLQEAGKAYLHYYMAELYTTVFNILPGGYEKAYKHAKKAIELDEGDLSYKEFILLFYELPTPLLSKEDAVRYAIEILKVDKNNQAAKLLMKGI